MDRSPFLPIDLLAVPTARRAAIEGFAPELVAGRRVALSTHLNADGDGCGSESALARMLAAHGLVPRVVAVLVRAVPRKVRPG